MKHNIVIYAPNINVGGGLVLLRALISNEQCHDCIFVLDERARDSLDCSNITKVLWVEKKISSRLKSEIYLRNLSNDFTIACLHNIPPVFRTKAKVIVFVQNRLLLESTNWVLKSYRIVIRTLIEKLVFRIHARHVSSFVVQTKSMAERLLTRKNSNNINVKICPFVDSNTYNLFLDLEDASSEDNISSGSVNVFIYPADDQAHKNHYALLNAWCWLAENNFFPRLELTLESNSHLLKYISDIRMKHPSINIVNLGVVEHSFLLEKYKMSTALIFPSTLESFGLPLIEANVTGLPIIASDLDYVYDVCSPVQTFIPSNHKSIARAVLRFLNIKYESGRLVSVNDFIQLIKG
jgi:glycosyltransferase involved in cell wall biosynthesis